MEKEEIAVSVLMLAYNHGNYIAQSLDSVFNQVTDFKFEVIVGEDCSPAPDRSREILLEYKKKYGDQLVLILHDHNVGGTENSLSVQRKARGKYLCGLECDDYWTDIHKLQRQFDVLEKHPEFSACGTDHKNVTDNGKDLISSNLCLKKDRLFTMEDYARKGYTVHGNTLMRRANLFPINDPDYIKLREVTPTMGDIYTFSISYYNGPIYVIKDVMLAHRDGGKVASSFSKSQETKIIYYTYLQMKMAKALEDYYHNKYDFSFIVVNRLAEVLVAYVFAGKKTYIDKKELYQLFRDNELGIRVRSYFRFIERVFQRGSRKIKRLIVRA